MRTGDYDYELPAELIAQEPLDDREGSRMMVIDRASGEIRHERFRDLPGHLAAGDALVVNDSLVIPARLLGHDGNGRKCEVLLLAEMEEGTWTAMVRPAKHVGSGVRVEIVPGELHVEILVNLAGSRRLVRLEGNAPISELIERHGHVPLPPYIDRPDRPEDQDRYQTVYAERPGSIAAPTAGLHFDGEVLGAVKEMGVDVIPITLHVGPGTFRPVQVDDPAEHVMEPESFSISPAAAEKINATREREGAIIAVGTTVTRVLEAVADREGRIRATTGETGLFIRPPHAFRAIDALITNFHLPRSTLLMLVSAFAGRERILEAYQEAIRERYRFYSYGDVMLIL